MYTRKDVLNGADWHSSTRATAAGKATATAREVLGAGLIPNPGIRVERREAVHEAQRSSPPRLRKNQQSRHD